MLQQNSIFLPKFLFWNKVSFIHFKFKLYSVLLATKTYFTPSHKKYKKICRKLLRSYIVLWTMKSCFRYDTLTIHKITVWCRIPPKWINKNPQTEIMTHNFMFYKRFTGNVTYLQVVLLGARTAFFQFHSTNQIC